jgi:hypothetical protein
LAREISMATEKQRAQTQTVYDSVTATTVNPERWEYLQILLGGEPDLNPYGAEGWELLFTTEHGFNERIYYFKRPKN